MFSPHSTRFFSASQAFLAGFLGGVDGFTSSFVNNEFATPLHKHFLCSVLGVDSGLGQIWPSLNLFLENLKTRAPSKQQASSCCCRRCCCWCFLCRFFPGSLVSFLLDSFRGCHLPHDKSSGMPRCWGGTLPSNLGCGQHALHRSDSQHCYLRDRWLPQCFFLNFWGHFNLLNPTESADILAGTSAWLLELLAHSDYTFASWTRVFSLWWSEKNYHVSGGGLEGDCSQ